MSAIYTYMTSTNAKPTNDLHLLSGTYIYLLVVVVVVVLVVDVYYCCCPYNYCIPSSRQDQLLGLFHGP